MEYDLKTTEDRIGVNRYFYPNTFDKWLNFTAIGMVALLGMVLASLEAQAYIQSFAKVFVRV